MGRLEVPLPDNKHHCNPPGRTIPALWADHPIDTRYFCDCGEVWIVRWVETTIHGSQATVSHAEWFHESWRERRRRIKGKDRLITPKPEHPPSGPSGISSPRDVRRNHGTGN